MTVSRPTLVAVAFAMLVTIGVLVISARMMQRAHAVPVSNVGPASGNSPSGAPARH